MPAERDVLEAERRLADALRHKDDEALERFVAPEYALVSRMGVMPREQWLRVAREYTVDEVRFDESDVHVYGDVAVARLRYWQNARLRGEDLTGTFLLTDVWVREDDAWRIVSRHSTAADLET